MPILKQIGGLLDIELRKGCDVQFTLKVNGLDVTGHTAVMSITQDTFAATLTLETIAPNQFYVDIPNSLTAQLPLKSRYIIKVTEPDADIKPLAYGTITCLDEPV